MRYAPALLGYTEKKCISIPVHVILFRMIFRGLFKKIKSFSAVFRVGLAEGRGAWFPISLPLFEVVWAAPDAERKRQPVSQYLLNSPRSSALKHNWNAKSIKTAHLSIDYICQYAWNNIVLLHRQLRFVNCWSPAMLWIMKQHANCWLPLYVG